MVHKIGGTMKQEPPEEGVRDLMAALGRRRMALMTKTQRRTLASSGGRSSWSGMSAEERVIEMKRRCRVRMRNRARKVLDKLGR